MTPISAPAGYRSYPQGDSVRGVGRDWGYSGKQQCGKRDEAAAASYGIHAAGNGARKKKEDGLAEMQTSFLS